MRVTARLTVSRKLSKEFRSVLKYLKEFGSALKSSKIFNSLNYAKKNYTVEDFMLRRLKRIDPADDFFFEKVNRKVFSEDFVQIEPFSSPFQTSKELETIESRRMSSHHLRKL